MATLSERDDRTFFALASCDAGLRHDRYAQH